MACDYFSKPDFDGTIVEGWEWISIFTQHLQGMWLLLHAGIKVKPCSLFGNFDHLSEVINFKYEIPQNNFLIT